MIIYTQLEPLGEKALKNLPVTHILTPCTGTDHIDMEYCNNHDIKVVGLKGEKFLEDVYATAEHTWALLLALIRKIPLSIFNPNCSRERLRGTELRNKTIGIIGYGRIGEQVSRYAEAFGMNVLLYDTKYFLNSSLDNLLEKSDVITLHIPLEGNKNFIDDIMIYKMKKKPYLINTSRGWVVSPCAILSGLLYERISGYATDVTENIPQSIMEELKNRDNVVITPHIGGNTYESRKKTDDFIVEKFKNILYESGGL